MNTLFFYDARSKSIYRFVATDALPAYYTENKALSIDVERDSKSHKPRKYFINIDDSKSRISKIMDVSKDETLMCIKTNPSSLKIITNLNAKKYKKFGVISFKDLENITEFKFLENNMLSVMGRKNLGSNSMR